VGDGVKQDALAASASAPSTFMLTLFLLVPTRRDSGPDKKKLMENLRERKQFHEITAYPQT
jgi:hypothetical protein